MRCRICGSELVRTITDLPFKIREQSTVVINDIPVFQCLQCPEFELEDSVMARVEELLKSVRENTRLEVVQFAA